MKRTIFAICAIFILAVVGLSFAQEKPEPKYYAEIHLGLVLKNDADETAIYDAISKTLATRPEGITITPYWYPATTNRARKSEEERNKRLKAEKPFSESARNSAFIAHVRTPIDLATAQALQALLAPMCFDARVESGNIGLALRTKPVSTETFQ
jgi:hypothetical protein